MQNVKAADSQACRKEKTAISLLRHKCIQTHQGYVASKIELR